MCSTSTARAAESRSRYCSSQVKNLIPLIPCTTFSKMPSRSDAAHIVLFSTTEPIFPSRLFRVSTTTRIAMPARAGGPRVSSNITMPPVSPQRAMGNHPSVRHKSYKRTTSVPRIACSLNVCLADRSMRATLRTTK